MKLEVGKKYKAKNGHIYQIIDTVEDPHYSFMCKAIIPGIYNLNRKWTADGHYWSDRSKSGFDLIEEVGEEIEDSEVSLPKPHNQNSIEFFDYVLSHQLNFFEGSIIEYITKWKYTNDIKYLEQSQQYLNKLIESTRSNS